ncbi:hypothetical protein FHX42_002498 [Saccharopolyspora lacisalsi]|uniref:CAAX prenyl protease 2/Lysostaphin resistance protein A-like domain-containing protein n=1 Tax=Halosaccharopolyspora lacisalsi TaxID=1000566 RepID=A0A839E077_9PSEU|nr:CPBP family intramembrane glutamic endopeptidase [Halosaccharopolyspora lacisalsi]MBA8825147.1 hypothetical protein [Halosaccharopolyspora lacisalsi]
MNSGYSRVDVRGVVGFVLIAYLPAWLMTLPLWLSGRGLSWEWAPALLVGMMFVPAVATFVVTRWISPARSTPRETGLTDPGGIRKWWPHALLAWFGPPLAAILALLVSYAFTLYDWTGFPVRDVLVDVVLLGWLGILPALGQEWGWRGYLVRALLPLGQPAAFLVSGVLWGLWYSPLLVLGYNYPTVPVVASFIMMICYCTLVGTLLGWLRLATRSVWPAVIAQTFLGAAAGLPAMLNGAGQPVSHVTEGLLSWPGWIVLGVLVLVLVGIRQLPVVFPSEHSTGISKGVRRLSRP